MHSQPTHFKIEATTHPMLEMDQVVDLVEICQTMVSPKEIWGDKCQVTKVKEDLVDLVVPAGPGGPGGDGQMGGPGGDYQMGGPGGEGQNIGATVPPEDGENIGDPNIPPDTINETVKRWSHLNQWRWEVQMAVSKNQRKNHQPSSSMHKAKTVVPFTKMLMVHVLSAPIGTNPTMVLWEIPKV